MSEDNNDSQYDSNSGRVDKQFDKHAEKFQKTVKSESKLQLPSWTKIGLILAAIILALVGNWAAKKQLSPNIVVDSSEVEAVEKREQLKDVNFLLREGGSKKLSDYKGKVVILSFWAAWCEPCLVELPSFAKLYEKFHDQGFEIITVNLDNEPENIEKANSLFKNKQFPFLFALDPKSELTEQFDVDSLPNNFVIDRQGRLVFSQFGSADWTSPQVVDLIANLLQEPAP